MRHAPPDWTLAVAGGAAVHVVVSERRHGDLGDEAEPALVEPRRRMLVDAPWSWCHQVHGAEVRVVAAPGAVRGAEGDGLCTAVVDAPVSVRVADCAPVVLADPAGIVGVVHAGWRGLMAGVIAAAVATMEQLGASAPVAVLGPCIRPQRYEFGAADLARVADRFGTAVVATTHDGLPALDLPRAVESALAEHGVEIVELVGGCTAAESNRRWSHRSRADRERQAVVAWIQRHDP